MTADESFIEAKARFLFKEYASDHSTSVIGIDGSDMTIGFRFVCRASTRFFRFCRMGRGR
ncbi:MAG: hypothetical protein ACLT98_08855 [Eggerthellaceae bacterium]